MKRGDDKDRGNWRKGLKLTVAGTLMLVLMSALVRSYFDQRDGALEAAMQALSSQFAERAQRLHGVWLMEQRPASVRVEGRLWRFSAQGWPQGVDTDKSPSEECQALWLALVERADLDGEPLQWLALQSGTGCEFRLGDSRWIYYWQDGHVLRMPRG